MKQGTFDEIVDKLQADEKALQKEKCADYAEPEADVLSNFKEAAEFAGITPLQAWAVYFYKHLCAIRAYIRGHKSQTDAIDERILDERIYLALFLGLTVDEAVKELGGKPSAD